jgi:YidC/Oxa1 family membrane protein insertase
MSIFSAFDAVVGVAHTLLDNLAAVTTPALAIIVCTIAVRLLVSPLTYLQVRAERRRAALAPQLRELRERHKEDPLALATETLALQRAAGAGPLVSMLPALAQAPFFMVLFRVATTEFAVGGGMALVVLLVALALALAWWSSRRMRRAAAEPVPRWLMLLPYVSVPAVAVLPPAGGLYLVTSAAWTALEHAIWRRPARVGGR